MQRVQAAANKPFFVYLSYSEMHPVSALANNAPVVFRERTNWWCAAMRRARELSRWLALILMENIGVQMAEASR